MRTIQKYDIDTGSVSVRMPRGARILHVGGQTKSVCLWAVIDIEPDRLEELRHFETYKDGDELRKPTEETREGLDGRTTAAYSERNQYIGTATYALPGQPAEFVYHVFERLE